MPEPEVQNPVPDPTPAIPAPTAMVQPFVSGGGPPPDMNPRPKRLHPHLIPAIFILLGLAAAGAAAAYIYYAKPFDVFKKVPVNSAATASPTPSPTAYFDVRQSVKSLDSSISSLDTSLAGADESLADQPGSLSE